MRSLFFILFIITNTVSANDSYIPLTINHTVVRAEIAADAATRTLGLSHRDTLAADAGLLLVFEKPHLACLWMSEVRFALAAAFINSDGIIIHVAHMMPYTKQLHCASQPAAYALEVNTSWLETHTLKVGDIVYGLPTNH